MNFRQILKFKQISYLLTNLFSLRGGGRAGAPPPALRELAPIPAPRGAISLGLQRYLLLQVHHLLLQLAHPSLLSVSGGLRCHSVFQLPEEGRHRAP